jgi:hypothetical protein
VLARLAVVALCFASGCCRETGRCPQNDVMVLVSADQASVPVTVIGYELDCVEQDGVTVCRPDAIADGEYELVVMAEGYAPQQVALSVRTNVAPSFSCECEVPRGSVSVELGGGSEPTPDAGTPMPDGG